MSNDLFLFVCSTFEFHHNIQLFAQRRNDRFKFFNAMYARIDVGFFFLIIFSAIDDIASIFHDLWIHAIRFIEENADEFLPKLWTASLWFFGVFILFWIQTLARLRSLLRAEQCLRYNANVAAFWALVLRLNTIDDFISGANVNFSMIIRANTFQYIKLCEKVKQSHNRSILKCLPVHWKTKRNRTHLLLEEKKTRIEKRCNFKRTKTNVFD